MIAGDRRNDLLKAFSCYVAGSESEKTPLPPFVLAVLCMNLPDNITLQATLEKSEEDKRPSKIALGFAWVGRLAVLLAVVLSPWMIASVDPRPQFWISVALLVGLGVFWFESALDRKGKQVFPYVAVPVFLGLVIGLLQVLPLPAGVVESIGGRQMDIYREYSVDAAPHSGRNQY